MRIAEITVNKDYKDRPKSGGAKVDQTTKPSSAKKSSNPPPELPKSLNPSEVHNYYMQMAGWHDQKSWMNKRISGLKPLWSDDRTMHDDRHLFHKAMRDGFAQKALAVDLAASMDGEKKGFGESLNESHSQERIQVSDRVLTLEQFIDEYGDTPITALRTGQIDRFTIIAEAHLFHPGMRVRVGRVDQYGFLGREAHPPTDGSLEGAEGHVTGYPDMRGMGRYAGAVGRMGLKYGVDPGPRLQSVMVHIKSGPHKGKTFNMMHHELAKISEAFSGTRPTGALGVINQNKSGISAKPLPMQSPFPSQVAKPAANKNVGTVPKMPTMPKTTEATKAVARGANVYDVLHDLTKF